jgi:AcrR family transcriptional regulator
MRMNSTSPRSTNRAASPPVKRGRPSRRPEIFASALRLFRDRGFHATSINDIGADAGVAGTAIYSHFATKQELLAEAIREGARRIRKGVATTIADSEQSPEEALESLVRAYVRVVLENADMNACYVLESRNLEAEVRQPLVRSERKLRDTWRLRLMAVRPELSREEAQTMVQMAIFALVALCVHRNRIDREALFALATSQVLGALRSPILPSTP